MSPGAAVVTGGIPGRQPSLGDRFWSGVTASDGSEMHHAAVVAGIRVTSGFRST